MAFSKRTEIQRPLARSERLLTEHIDDELVIYDELTKTAHALKPLAAAVFLYADGRNSVGEITGLVAYRLGEAVREADVANAVDELRNAALLDEPELGVSTVSEISRRTALKTFAAAGVVAGTGSLLITSVATAAGSSNSNCPGSAYNSNTYCGSYGAVIGSCSPCHQQSDCSSGFVCAVVPCDAGSGCGQTVCVPSKTATWNKFPTLPAGTKICPSGDHYYTLQGYQYKCCSPGSKYYADGCSTSDVYTSMVDGSTTCGCNGTIVNNSQCCPYGYTYSNGICKKS